MRSSTVVMIGLAVVFGVLAVFVAQSWLDRQASLRLSQIQAQSKPPAEATVVVAAVPLRFGMEIDKQHLREIGWPAGAVPAGAFATAAELLGGDGKRVVLTPIEPNEPILQSKITGPGQRGTLSAILQEGMKAVTVRVNDVLGVAGFVLPGDRVDVLLTRQFNQGDSFTDVLLQNIRVLGVDQTADERTDKPSVVKAVTLEVGTYEAQKVALATSVGTLSLTLRKAGEVAAEPARRVTVGDLGQSAASLVAELPNKAPLIETANDEAAKTRGSGPADSRLARLEPRAPMATVGVTRAAKRQEYTVPIEAEQ